MKVEVGGIEAFNTSLNNWGKDFEKKVLVALAETALNTKALAQLYCQPRPEDGAELTADITAVRASVNFALNKEAFTANVFAGNTEKDHFAAYLEFGTGEHAARYLRTLPWEYTVLAWQFFVNGAGTMREHPFLIRSYLEQGPKFVKKLNSIRPDFR